MDSKKAQELSLQKFFLGPWHEDKNLCAVSRQGLRQAFDELTSFNSEAARGRLMLAQSMWAVAMNLNDTQIVPTSGEQGCPSAEIPIAQLVAQVYETAPPALRISLLEQLLKPLGVLSLMAIANGIFAKIRFSSGWPDMHIRFEDAQKVQASDAIALVERVQQVSVTSVDGLAKLLTTSPVMAGSASAALLATLIMQRARTRRDGDAKVDDSLAGPTCVT